MLITRLRVDHTGLGSTLLITGRRNSESCDNCGVKGNAEHVILHCVTYEVERRVFQARVQEAEPEWSLMGILGTEGEGGKIRITRKALDKFLNNTGLMSRI